MDFFTQNLPVTLPLPTNLRPGSNFLHTDGKPVGACELMFKSTGGYPMATKASGILVFIIEKQYASWGLMCSTLPALELRFRRQPHIASLVGPSGPCTIVVVCACVELTNGLLLACIPTSGLLRLGWQQLDTHIMGLGADWSDTVPRRRSGWASSTAAGVCPVVSHV